MQSKTSQLLRALERLVNKYGLVGAVGILNSLSDIRAKSTTRFEEPCRQLDLRRVSNQKE